MGSQIRLERVINGFIVSTGAYRKSVYPTLDKAIEVIRKLVDDDIKYERERKEKMRALRSSPRQD